MNLRLLTTDGDLKTQKKDDPGTPFIEIANNQHRSSDKKNVETQEPLAEPKGKDEDKPQVLSRRVFELNTRFAPKQMDRDFPNNLVTTTSYTKCNFFPKNLFLQLLKVVNAYFVFLILLQIVPGIGQPNGSLFTMLPLTFVILVSMVKDKIEDSKRRAQDDKDNNQEVLACEPGDTSFTQVKSLDLEVGSIVKVRQDEAFPADLIIIKSSLPRGICYVETKNLDGETNMKQKLASEHVEKRIAGEDAMILQEVKDAKIDCEGPNEYLYRFEGKFILKDGSQFPIDPDQVLLKGSSLRNTEWIIGVCVYTGHDTKIMKNSASSVIKRSKNQKQLNYFVLVSMVIQLTFSIIGSAILSVWTEYEGGNYWYLYPN